MNKCRNEKLNRFPEYNFAFPVKKFKIAPITFSSYYPDTIPFSPYAFAVPVGL